MVTVRQTLQCYISHYCRGGNASVEVGNSSQFNSRENSSNYLLVMSHIFQMLGAMENINFCYTFSSKIHKLRNVLHLYKHILILPLSGSTEFSLHVFCQSKIKFLVNFQCFQGNGLKLSMYISQKCISFKSPLSFKFTWYINPFQKNCSSQCVIC